jgi:hypothetical protein
MFEIGGKNKDRREVMATTASATVLLSISETNTTTTDRMKQIRVTIPNQARTAFPMKEAGTFLRSRPSARVELIAPGPRRGKMAPASPMGGATAPCGGGILPASTSFTFALAQGEVPAARFCVASTERNSDEKDEK